MFSVGTNIVFNSASSPTVFVVATSTRSGTTPNFITTVTTTVAFTGTPTSVFAYATPIAADANRQWQFDAQFSPTGGALQLLAHGGITLKYLDTNTTQPLYSGNVLPAAGNNWTFAPVADTAGQNPTGKLINATNGVVSLYPFIFVYGANGFIANNHVNQDPLQRTIYDWNGAFANQVNVTAGNIVKAFPVRGGNASPSGLFWAIDSLIRVSFNSGGGAGLYWSYDLISKISILSSNSVVPAGNIYYWLGTDCAYLYNGTVQKIPMDSHANYFFDNINYEQRQKVFGLSVPRFGEIWWFYPRGNAEENTDVLVYNVAGKFWFDLGSAVGCRRSCGFATEVFDKPIIAGYDQSAEYVRQSGVAARPPSLPVPTANSFYVLGDQTAAFAPGNFASLRNSTPEVLTPVLSSLYYFAATYSVTLVTTRDPLSAATPAVGTAVWAASFAGFPVWQHETGYDRVEGSKVSSIYSSFETPDISWIGGNPSGDSPQGADKTTRLVRVEPNFKQVGDMQMSVIGRAYPSSETEYTTGPFTFNNNTSKIYTRGADYRLLRLQFSSDTIGGAYELGRMLVQVDQGGARPNE